MRLSDHNAWGTKTDPAMSAIFRLPDLSVDDIASSTHYKKLKVKEILRYNAFRAVRSAGKSAICSYAGETLPL